MAISTVTLNSGYIIPQFGLGTYKLPKENAQEIVREAALLGYRHFDTAQMYQNEAEVAAGIRESGIPREEFFITSKLLPQNHLEADAKHSFAESLEKMQLDYIDLFLIHWPMPHLYDGNFPATWRVLEEFVASGRAKSIGVSNFMEHHLEKLMQETSIVPAVNQIESHPYLQMNALHNFCAEHGIAVEAWSPLARGQVFDEPAITSAAQAHGKTASQVTLRWALQRGDIVFPKTESVSRLAENLNVFDFTLSADEIAAINALDKGEAGRIGPHPDKLG
ncbi:oxidoreductase, aldo/keto reductase family protein [Gleimia coleocanis DSM 15436]|uniref:Oxidoreductase, aldo/keto reductase family protein n=1 Tax=Gleimia coleocanis DSM 15436 TaxID=525245 RepID=C0VYA6_9ACTO|nr:aldo/keto reductase [Gleimia coleocanis]EEH64409.1 oxidoreductase, aldo/keto reductase family protein [Gleimia coleocanis DSM 15436]